MTIEPAEKLAPEQILFTSGPRIGWTYRSHRDLIPAYSEPEPSAEAIRSEAEARVAEEQKRWQRALKWGVRPSLIVFVGLMALAGCAHALNPSAPLGTTAITALVLAAPGLGWSAYRFWQLRLAKATDPRHLYEVAHAGWASRAAAFEKAELERVASVPEWGSAVASSRRVDIFGGTLEGWRSLHVVHGASAMADRPVLIADLTGQDVASELAALTRDVGADVDSYVLPRDLDRSGLLSQLSPRQLADALAEAIHAGAPGGARADRAVDVRVLEQLCSALSGGGITPARLAAGVDVALGRAAAPGVLTSDECALIQGKLFGEAYLPQISANLIRLDAFLADLAQHAGGGAPAGSQFAYCTIFAVEPAARSARSEVIAALVVQWLTVTVAASGSTVPAVVVAGADEISRPHLEGLADACDRKQVPLTLLFRHLRDDAAALIGGGATAFMRLGNHIEAEQAASFIGRGHKFVLSGFTTTRGGERSFTRGTTQTWGHSESRGFNKSRGWSEDHMLGGGSSSGSDGRSRDYSKNYSFSVEQSETHGTNWSDGRSTERVYEYTVEPTVLQNLPDNALLLVQRSSSTRLESVECDPEIVTFPLLTTSPHAPVPVVPPVASSHPTAAEAGEEQAALTPPRPQPVWPGSDRGEPRHVRRPARRESRKAWWEQD
jgi:hypothetical protein